MTGFTKLFSSTLCSTVWRRTDKDTKILWMTLLMLADKHGVVDASLIGLADQAMLSEDETTAALQVLMSPDRHSKNKEHEGRRLLEIDGGWQIINYGKYRAKQVDEERRAKALERQKKYLERKKAEKLAAAQAAASTNV